MRAALGGGAIQELPGALIPPGSDNKGAPVVPASPIAVDEAAGTITNGNIAASVGPDVVKDIVRRGGPVQLTDGGSASARL